MRSAVIPRASAAQNRATLLRYNDNSIRFRRELLKVEGESLFQSLVQRCTRNDLTSRDGLGRGRLSHGTEGQVMQEACVGAQGSSATRGSPSSWNEHTLRFPSLQLGLQEARTNKSYVNSDKHKTLGYSHTRLGSLHA